MSAWRGKKVWGNPQWQTSLKLGFIRKVYGIVFSQLFLTFITCLLSLYNQNFKLFQTNYPILIWLSLSVIIGFFIITVFFDQFLRKFPSDYILLLIYTFCIAYLSSYLCSTLDQSLVVLAISATLILTLTLTIYAWFSSKEIDTTMCFYFCLGVMFVLFSTSYLVFSIQIIPCIICFICISIFSLFLIIDTKMIIQNGSTKGLKSDDYILGAFLLFTDIILLFVELLELFTLLFRSNS
jgi:FtsH-binding integral membrane protein